MYTLFVSGEVGDRGNGAFTVGAGRFLKYTSMALASQLESLSTEAIGSFRSWPCILMQEGREQEKAYIARLDGVQRRGGDICLTAVPVPGVPEIQNEVLWSLRHELDIEDFEFHHHHFAVKERDLIKVLADNHRPLDAAAIGRFNVKPIQLPTRAALIGALDVVGNWGHPAIDRFLMEAGVQGLSAGRELGGRQSRANAIVEFAIKNPSATTAENSLFSSFLLSRVSPQVEQPVPSQAVQASDDKPAMPPPVTSSAEAAASSGIATVGKSSKPNSLKLFYCYSHKDEELRNTLQAHVSLLKRQGVIDEWHDRKISAGSDWKGHIDAQLAVADIVLLLISADFIASDYCYDIEMQKALERHSTGQARVIPVILRAVDDWTSAPFGKLQALPTDGKPITSWDNHDEAFTSVARGLRRAATELRAKQVKNEPIAQTPTDSAGDVRRPHDEASAYRFLVKEGEKVPFDSRVIGDRNFIYDFSIDVPFVAIDGIKAYVRVYLCSGDGSRKLVAETDALVTQSRPFQIPRTTWQVLLVETKSETAVVELRREMAKPEGIVHVREQ